MQKITSSSNPKFKEALRLHASRGRRAQNRIIVFGSREVFRCQQRHGLAELYVDQSRISEEDREAVVQLESGGTCAVFELTPELFGKLNYGDRSDGVIAVSERPDTDLSRFSPPENGLLLVVESIEKPGNLGALVRTVDAIGGNGIIACGGGTDFFHPNSIRNSMSTVFSVPLAVCTTPAAKSWLIKNSLQVLLADSNGAVNFFEQDLASATAIVLGNEANGLSPAWSDDNFARVALPMRGMADSLNVSATGAVMLYEALRQRSSGR